MTDKLNIRGDYVSERALQVFKATVARLSIWSQATFGLDTERGPEGALKHLRKEVDETLEAQDDILEYADCLILIVDAARRAGISTNRLIGAMSDKMAVNESREWPEPTADNNTEPIEHVRDDE